MIKLWVGLGNPGNEYQDTRHNVGFWFIEKLAQEWHASLQFENKFQGLFAKHKIHLEDHYLLKPQTFMNLSGRSIQQVSHFFKIKPEEIMVVHDELDLPVGQIKLKQSGGHGGHNGLRDTHASLSSPNYWRLRVGIDHPGDKQQVAKYVLSRPNKTETIEIEESLERALRIVPLIIDGKMNQAMKELHTQP